ncbi:MAG: hypothetical protein IJ783_11040, partial [Kiritimatiellae bacterium]|nr:hypothetical protein [Kiritimatiellia bacterium]
APRLVSVERETGLAGTRFVVTFSEEVEESAVTLDRFALSRTDAALRPSGAPSKKPANAPAPATALPAGATLENLGGGAWALSGVDSAILADGVYTLSFSADGVTDEAGNEAEGQGSVSWTQDTTPPDPVTGLRISPDLGSSDSDGITSDPDVTVLGTLPGDAATVEIFVRWTAGGAETALVAPFTPSDTALAAAATLPGSGSMTLVVRCADESGNASETEMAVFVDPAALVATLSGVPSDAAEVADEIVVSFSDAVDASTVALSDFALYRDGSAVPLDGAELVAGNGGGAPAPSASAAFALTGLSAICAEDGLYRLVFDGSRAAKALTGLKMDAGAAAVSAEWTRFAPDVEAPFVTGVAIDGAARDGEFFDTVSAIDISFSEPVNVPDLVADGWIAQAVKLSRLGADGGIDSVLLPLADEVSWDDESATLHWSLPAGLVGHGDWRVSLDSGFIADAAGNALSAGGADATVAGLVRFDADAPVAVSVASYAMPSFGDFDGDGAPDLLVGEKSADGMGRIRLFRNTGLTGEGRPVFAAAGTLAAGGAEIALQGNGCQGASAALVPRSAASGVLDLVVGDALGNVWLHQAAEDDEAGGWGEGALLVAGSDEEFGSARAVVSASDVLGTGRPTLVYGGMDGKFRRVAGQLRRTATAAPRNSWLGGTDGEPLRVAAGRSSPAAFDLNGDGIPDLVSGDTTGNVWAFLGDGRLSWQSRPILLLAADTLPDRSRVALADFAGAGSPTLAVGRSDGTVRLHSGVPAPSPAFAFVVKRTPPALAEALDAPECVWETGNPGDAWEGAWTEPVLAAKGDNAAVPGGDGAWFKTTFSGAGMIAFRVCVLEGAGSVSFAVDGTVVEEIGEEESGIAGESETAANGRWTEISVAVGSGTHDARWVWTAGGGDAAPPMVDAVSWTPAPWADSAAAAGATEEFREWLVGYGLLAEDGGEGAFVAAALADTDRDGHDAWEEFVALTDPTDPGDRLVAGISIDEGGAPVVTWTPDRTGERDYVVEAADEVSGPYEPVDPAAEDGSAPSRFYRVKVLLK